MPCDGPQNRALAGLQQLIIRERPDLGFVVIVESGVGVGEFILADLARQPESQTFKGQGVSASLVTPSRMRHTPSTSRR